MIKTVLITGGATGIGRAIARRFSDDGFEVYVIYNSSATSAAELEGGLSVKALRADVGDFASVTAAVSRIDRKIGVLINNAGVSLVKLLTETTDEEFDRVVGVNLKGVFNVTKAVLPQMLERKQGAIVNVASEWGITGAAMETVYSASKAGVIGLTKALAREVGLSGVRVNCVCPSATDTAMLSRYSNEERADIAADCVLGRIIKPSEIADICAYLASDAASSVTGQIIGNQ